MKIDFDDSLLYITARSPFARRVRLVFREHGVRFDETVLDLVKSPNEEYWAVNPLKRVPAVRLRTGEIIIDSNEILAAFYDSQPESPLRARTVEDAVCSRRWSGISAGLCEKLVEYFFEMQRPEATRDPELLTEIHLCVENVTRELDRHMQGRKWIVSQLSQADLDTGAMLDYLNLRYSRDWMKVRPHVVAYLERLHSRPSFRATQPPPPAP